MNNKVVLGGIGCLGLIVIFFLIMGTALFSANNTANAYEKSIKATHENSRNVLGQYAPKLKEALGVTKIQAEAVEEIITASNESRYGEAGSQASMQWIREQNPNLDQSSYRQVLNLIEAGRNDFQREQTAKLDKIRAYETALGNMPGSFFMKVMGYPTAEFVAADYGKIVTSGHADEAFTTGRDDGVDISGF